MTPCEGSHRLVNLQVCVFVAPSTRAKRGEGGVTHPVVSRVLPALAPSPRPSRPPPLLLLKSGLQHGNENCHPVPAVIMEFRGGRHRLNHNGIKEA